MRKSRLVLMLAAALFVGFLLPVGSVAARGDELPEAVPVVVTHEREADAPAPYAWFGSSMSLVTFASTARHYFDGNSIGIEMTCSAKSAGTFSVSLYKELESGRGALLGTATFNRIGFTKATWQGVGPGTYYFIMSKPNDGVLVTSSDVAMYSW